MYPKVSIITVVFNAVNILEKAINSVLNQSYKNIEYIIIDGGSTDGTIDVIKKYEDRISLWISEPDQGIYDAMNKGIRYSNGDVIAFINADDCYEEDIILKIANVFHENDVDIVYGNVKITYDNGYEVISRPLELEQINMGMCMCHQAVFAKRSLFMQYGLFNLNYQIAADYEALLKWYNVGAKYMYVDLVCANYGVRGVSSTERAKCAQEIYDIAISYLDTEEKKKKYLGAILEKKIISDRNTKRKEKIKEREGEIIKRINRFSKTNGKIFIFGCGCEAVDCYKLFTENGILFHGYIDNDVKKQGMKLKEYYIYSPSILKNKKEKVIVSSVKYGKEISKQLEEMGYKYKEDFIFLHDLLEEE